MKRIAAILLVTAAGGLALWWGVASGDDEERADMNAPPEVADAEPPDLRGTVADSNGTPVEKATVVATSGEQRREAETGSDGSFAFEDLPPRSYRIDVQADGFVAPGPRPLREVPVQVPEESKADGPVELDLTVRRPATIEGRVVSGEEPVESARLSLYYLFAEGFRRGLDPFTLSNEGTTQADGSFRLNGVAPGRLRIIAETEPHPPRRSRELFVEAGETLDEVRIDLDPRGVLTGKVVGSEGDPVAATLTVSGGRLPAPRETEADRRGNFRFTGLPAGTYELTAGAEGHHRRTYEDVEVERDRATQRAVLLQRGRGLFGRVLGPEGDPVSGAYVRLQRDGETQWRRTRNEGRFQWKGASEGNWSARAYSPKYATSQTTAAQVGRPVELKLRPGGYLRGRIVDSAGSPVSGAEVGVATMLFDGPRPYGPRAAGVEKVESENGAFRFGPLRPGRYELQVRKSGYAPAGSAQRVVEGGQTTGEIELVLGLGGTVSGVVRSSADGTPVSGARVSASDMTSPFDPERTKTDEKGRFSLDRIPSGRRSLRIHHENYLARVVSGLQVPEGGTVERNIELRPDEKGKKFGFQGIGASLRRTDRGVEIRRVTPGGGAEEQGLQQGDVIRAVDREAVDDMPLSRVVQRIRGRGGEPVELTLERDGRGTFTVEVVRDRVVVEDRGRN